MNINSTQANLMQFPEETLNLILSNTFSTKTLLMFSQCSKQCYGLVFKNNPALMLINDLVQSTIKNNHNHIEHKEPKTRGGLRNLVYYPPSSNKYLMYPIYENSILKNYDVTPIDDGGEFTLSFKSDLKELIDKEMYESDKTACERKLFKDLLTYAKNKNAFIVDIGLKVIKNTNDMKVISIKKREFGESDCSRICLEIFRFSGECRGGGKLDEPFTKNLKEILNKNEIIIRRPLKPKTDTSSENEQSKKHKIKKIEDLTIQKIEVPTSIQKPIDELDDACKCTLF